MTLQMIVVDDAAIGATANAGVTSDGVTLTTDKAIAGTSLTLSSSLVGGSATDITIDTDKFTVDASTGDTVMAGDATVGGALSIGGAVGFGTEIITVATSVVSIDVLYSHMVGAADCTLGAGTYDGQLKMMTGTSGDDVTVSGYGAYTFLGIATIETGAVTFVWSASGSTWILFTELVNGTVI